MVRVTWREVCYKNPVNTGRSSKRDKWQPFWRGDFSLFFCNGTQAGTYSFEAMNAFRCAGVCL